MSVESRDADELAAVWRQQLISPLTLTPAELRAENQSLRRKVRISLLAECVGCVAVIAAMLIHWFFSENRVSHVTYVAFVVATLWVMRGLHVRMGDRGEVPLPVELLAFQRATLERLRSGLATAWRWYLLPFAVPIVMVVLDRWLFTPIPNRPAHVNHIVNVGFVAFTVVFFVAVWLWHQVIAARLQRRIDYLDTFTSNTRHDDVQTGR
jgi:uncharacterized membrane protein